MTVSTASLLSSAERVEGYLDRAAQRDAAVGAWAHLDPDLVRAYAADADRVEPRSPLHGIPIGLKDIINTADQPTGYGAEAWTGFQPAEDAEAVRRLRAAGAVIMGKTTTTEFATYSPTATRNPHDLGHTPGGSSAGSAAAVADGQVQLALGTQTGGSVNRPGSFCGTFTFKPTFGRWPFDGVLPVALTFDTLGGFARDPRELALLDDVLAHPAPQAVHPSGPPRPARDRALPPLGALRVGVLRGPWFDRAEPEAVHLLEASAEFLSRRVGTVAEVGAAPELDELQLAHADIQSLEAGFYLQQMIKRDPFRVSALLKSEIAHAHSLSADQQQARRGALRDATEFADRALTEFDVLVTLAACGEAPATLESTGDPAFNRLASTAGLPAAGLPVGAGAHGLPLGLQIIGPRHADRSLLALVIELTFEHGLTGIPALPATPA